MKKCSIYGYVRVSTKEQNEARQVAAMRKYGVKAANIIVEKESGKDFNRPKYRKLVHDLKEGDTLVVKSIDRLGRNYEDIIRQWRLITKEKNADIVVLDMPLLDTRQGKDLTGTLIADIVLQLLSYVAQTERNFIRQRQAEGIAVAKANGIHFGARGMEKPADFERCYREHVAGRLSARAAAQELNISHPTFLRWVHAAERTAEAEQ